MSKLEVDAIEPQSGTTLTIGASGDTVTIPSGASITLTDGVSGDFKMNSGYGSVATAYGVRAWVNFNGTGTVAIRGSGNVSSITDTGTGAYTVNFTTNMPDTNYAVVINAATTYSSANQQWQLISAYQADAVGSTNIDGKLVDNDNSTFVSHDIASVMIGVFR